MKVNVNPFPTCSLNCLASLSTCASVYLLSTSLRHFFLFTKKQQQQQNPRILPFFLAQGRNPLLVPTLGGHQNGSHDYHRFNTSALSGRSPAGPETDPLEVPIKSFGLWSQGKKEGKEELTMRKKKKKKPNEECPPHEQHGANGSDSHPADILLWPHALVSGTQVTGTEGCVWSHCCSGERTLWRCTQRAKCRTVGLQNPPKIEKTCPCA